MRTHKRLLISLAAFAVAGLVGCLNSPETALSTPVTESEIQAALASDSAHPAPVRPAVCDTLKARLAAMDSTSPGFKGHSIAVIRVCKVRPVRPVKPDSLRPVKPDSLRPLPPSCDSLKARLAGLDSTSTQFRKLSLRVAHACKVRPVRPEPPKPPRPDSAGPK